MRDVEGMGLASAWLVLGLGWMVEFAKVSHRKTQTARIANEDFEALVMPARSPSKANITDSSESAISRRESERDRTASPDLSHTSSDQTDSTVLKTPYTEEGPNRSPGGEIKERSEYEQLKLLVSRAPDLRIGWMSG